MDKIPDMGMIESNVGIDLQRGHKAAELLYRAFSTTGIHGHTEMPEDTMPTGISNGSLEHLLFITLTVAIDYQRDAIALWRSSRRTFDDPETRYLFDPRALHEAEFSKVITDMRRHGLSQKPKQDALIWRTVGVTFFKKWSGDPRQFLADCGWDAPTVLERLRRDTHIQRNRAVPDFPFLRGPKIGPLWLRMLRDNVGVADLKALDQVPIPVDIHVARASLCLGVVKGRFSGPLTDLFEHIRSAWFQSTKGLRVKDRAMIALDVDEPLWHLSKYGCSQKDGTTGVCPARDSCEAKEFCVAGTIRLSRNVIEMDT
jgi:hypothetical protein